MYRCSLFALAAVLTACMPETDSFDVEFDAKPSNSHDAELDAHRPSEDGAILPSGDAGESDAGALDAGENDAGENDAGENDAGENDAGESDAGALDAGALDAGESDAGESDAGESDAGESDAGENDAGESDAGESDATLGECSQNEDCTEICRYGQCIEGVCHYDDNDHDGWCDAYDNCPTTANPDQANHDNDAFGDLCDNDDCTGLANCCDNDSDCCGDSQGCERIGELYRGEQQGYCTHYSCENFTCQSRPIDNCCIFSSDCTPSNACHTATCNDNRCEETSIPDCCIEPSDCTGDLDLCETHICEQNRCNFVEIPDCCSDVYPCDPGFGCNENHSCSPQIDDYIIKAVIAPTVPLHDRIFVTVRVQHSGTTDHTAGLDNPNINVQVQAISDENDIEENAWITAHPNFNWNNLDEVEYDEYWASLPATKTGDLKIIARVSVDEQHWFTLGLDQTARVTVTAPNDEEPIFSEIVTRAVSGKTDSVISDFELFNPTASPINLSNYAVSLDPRAGLQDISLSGTLEPGTARAFCLNDSVNTCETTLSASSSTIALLKKAPSSMQLAQLKTNGTPPIAANRAYLRPESVINGTQLAQWPSIELAQTESGDFIVPSSLGQHLVRHRPDGLFFSSWSITTDDANHISHSFEIYNAREQAIGLGNCTLYGQNDADSWTALFYFNDFDTLEARQSLKGKLNALETSAETSQFLNLTLNNAEKLALYCSETMSDVIDFGAFATSNAHDTYHRKCFISGGNSNVCTLNEDSNGNQTFNCDLSKCDDGDQCQLDVEWDRHDFTLNGTHSLCLTSDDTVSSN